MPTFRLDQEPWIPVVFTGTERQVNLIEIFEQAPHFQRLAGEPLEVAALTRLLLAIAHATCTPANLAEWKKIWDNRPNFLSAIVTYIRQKSSFWDLYSADFPFLQSTELRGNSGFPLDSNFLDRSKSGRDSHLDHSTYMSSFSLGSSAAARALLALHTFCMGGMGTPNPLIPRRGKDRDKFSSNSLAAQSCVAFLEGETLQDTILFNLIAGTKVGTPGWCWGTPHTREKIPSTGVADNYCRPTRTVLLYPSDDGRTAESAFVTSGAAFADSDAKDDPLIPHVKKKNDYSPFQFEKGVQLWRAANVLLSIQDKPLPVVKQMGLLTRNYNLVIPQATLRVAGVTGELGKVKHYFWRDESLPFGMSVITDDARFSQLDHAVQSAFKRAKETGKCLYAFAARYLQNGAASAPDKNDIRKLANELSPNLTDFWAALASAGERIACEGFDETAWAARLKEASENAIRNAINRLPPDARRYRAEFNPGTKQKKGETV